MQNSYAGTPVGQQIIPQVPQFPPAISLGPEPVYVQPGMAVAEDVAVAELLNPGFVAYTLTVADWELFSPETVIVAPLRLALPAVVLT